MHGPLTSLTRSGLKEQLVPTRSLGCLLNFNVMLPLIVAKMMLRDRSELGEIQELRPYSEKIKVTKIQNIRYA